MNCGLKPDHKVIKSFYEETESSIAQNHDNEGNLSSYFVNILQHCVKKNPNREFRTQFEYIENKKRLVFDGAIFNKFNDTMLYGIWEAKDLKDNLEKEIAKKFKDGYPKDNILFQTPHRLVLFQNGERCFDKNIENSPTNLIDGLEIFFNYSKPAYENWEKASEAFKEKVEKLGKGLIELIIKQLQQNQRFTASFEHFKNLCLQTINPRIVDEMIMEMLAQHLLTERLFRNVFDNPNFIQKNTIAKEIENVLFALTSEDFNRDSFLKELDHFYLSIETAAKTFNDFYRKQTFLNKIYEQFFQGFAIKTADKHGIVYTPQPIVEFMINSVEELLKKEFDLSLSSSNVNILDPFVGTGNFIVHILDKINLDNLKHKYQHEIHCNEINLLPYYVATINIEHAYFERTNEYLAFEGVCLVDTFETLDATQTQLFNFENAQRVKNQKEKEIFVIIGNPPYNAWQQNENDNNKNRKYGSKETYESVDDFVKKYYAKSSKSTNKNALYDPYVKAIAWATQRLEKQDSGIVAFVTNNGFIDNLAFDGMRKHLSETFSSLYVFDLGGNVRKNNGVQNVFNIKVGVSINLLIKKPKKRGKIYYAHIGDHLSRQEKLDELTAKKMLLKVDWKKMIPDNKYNWLTEGLHSEFDTFIEIGSKEEKINKQTTNVIFKTYGGGVKTNRDAWCYNFNRKALAKNMEKTIQVYNHQTFDWLRRKDKTITVDDFIEYNDKKLSWSEGLKKKLEQGKYFDVEEHNIRIAHYRPFTKQYLYFDKDFNERVYQFPQIFPTLKAEQENIIIWIKVGMEVPFFVLCANTIVDLLPQSGSQCFPFYTYNESGMNRQENITDWALETYQKHYQDQKIEKRDIFYYVYGLLHAKNYREKYAQNLKKELPRIPFVKDFWLVSNIGKQLADLHLNYENVEKYPLEIQITEPIVNWRDNRKWKVEKMRLSKNKKNIVYNEEITLRNIPEKVFEYKLGNRTALEWVIEQYRVKTDERSGIINDPNQMDNERYIVDLIMKIVTVSIKTVDLTEQLDCSL
jgi:predicted helicase